MSHKARQIISSICIAVAIVLFACGGFLIFNHYRLENERCIVIQEVADDMDQYIQNDENKGKPLVIPVDLESYTVPGEEYDFGEDTTYEEEPVITGIGLLQIPAINARLTILEGTTTKDLRYGVGHYIPSAGLGEAGNCSILGHHMKAYGSIFNRLSEVDVGDEIIITDIYGCKYTYIVDDTTIVTPEEMMNRIAKGDDTDARITLVTCAYTNQGKQRLIVTGHMI